LAVCLAFGFLTGLVLGIGMRIIIFFLANQDRNRSPPTDFGSCSGDSVGSASPKNLQGTMNRILFGLCVWLHTHLPKFHVCVFFYTSPKCARTEFRPSLSTSDSPAEPALFFAVLKRGTIGCFMVLALWKSRCKVSPIVLWTVRALGMTLHTIVCSGGISGCMAQWRSAGHSMSRSHVKLKTVHRR
jgi:hypothetical protein